jgi:aspartyl-tRNA(Asn)/glutamyl-tRNA(Gln) amidotransferase subunit A
MFTDEFFSQPFHEWSRSIRNRRVSPVELVEATVSRIEAIDPSLHSFITFCPDQAMDRARRAEREIARGRYLGPLHGIPMALKDLYNSAELRTTYGSRIFGDYNPQKDATALLKLKQGGAIQLGKLNLHEFAYGATSANPHYGTARNPWNTDCIPGGSSGGSAAAVRAGLVGFSLGSDTGGSIRIPAALCGIVGLKPTYGRISRNGMFPLSWSMDHAGPMTRTVRDAAFVLNAVAGPDPGDPATFGSDEVDYVEALGSLVVRGLKIGVPERFFLDLIDQEVAEAYQRALDLLRELGLELVPVSLPLWDHTALISSLILGSEASSVHRALMRKHKDKYDPIVKNRILFGYFITADQYLLGQRMRRLLIRQMDELMQQIDLLVTPTTPICATPVGQDCCRLGGADHEVDALLLRCTRLANQTGQPAISLPCGFSKRGLPVGLQLVGRLYDEITVLRTAAAFEAATDFHLKFPEVADR